MSGSAYIIVGIDAKDIEQFQDFDYDEIKYEVDKLNSEHETIISVIKNPREKLFQSDPEIVIGVISKFLDNQGIHIFRYANNIEKYITQLNKVFPLNKVVIFTGSHYN